MTARAKYPFFSDVDMKHNAITSLLRIIFDALSTPPTEPVFGSMYFADNGKLKVWDGQSWNDFLQLSTRNSILRYDQDHTGLLAELFLEVSEDGTEYILKDGLDNIISEVPIPAYSIIYDPITNHINLYNGDTIESYVDVAEFNIIPKIIPISPESPGIVAGTNLTNGQIVYRCKTDNKLYPISDTEHYVDLDWGLGLVKKDANINSFINGDYIAQQGVYDYGPGLSHGYTYFIKLVKDSTGCKIHQQIFDNILEPDGVYIYIGVAEYYNTIRVLACDFSSHTFFELKDGQIVAINGRPINTKPIIPVSSDTLNPPIGEGLYKSLVFRCKTDGKLYNCISQNAGSKPMDLEWGLAVYPDLLHYSLSEERRPEPNSLLQKCEFDYTSYTQEVFSEGEPLFLIVRGENEFYSNGVIASFSTVLDYSVNNGFATYIYLGINTNGRLSIDLTNHTFYTITGAGKLVAVNGKYLKAGLEHPVVPVSVDSELPIAGEDINAGVLVFKSTDGKLYDCIGDNMETKHVDLNWGLALNTELCEEDNYPNENSLVHKGEFSDLNSYIPNTQHYTTGTSLYMVFNYEHSLNGGYYSAGLIGDFNYIKSLAFNDGEVTFMYIGTYTHNSYLSLDVTNHTVYTINNRYRISRINGAVIEQPSVPAIPTYDNPVAGEANMPVIGGQITQNCLVFLGKQNQNSNEYLYKIGSSAENYLIMPDFGLAIYTGSNASNPSRPQLHTILQQCDWNGNGIDLLSFQIGEQIYAVFGTSTSDINGIYNPTILADGLVLKTRSGMLSYCHDKKMEKVTYCYIGCIVSDGQNKSIAVDLSAHKFVTEYIPDNKIVMINGVSVGADDIYTMINGSSGIYGLFGKSLCARDRDGEISSFTQTGGTNTNKLSATSIEFPIGSQIYFNQYLNLTNGEEDFNSLFASKKNRIDIRFTGNVTETYDEGTLVYLHVTVNNYRKTFSPASASLITTYLSNGEYYILLGTATGELGIINFEGNSQIYQYFTERGLIPYGVTTETASVYMMSTATSAYCPYTLTNNTTVFKLALKLSQKKPGLYICNAFVDLKVDPSGSGADVLVAIELEQTNDSNFVDGISRMNITGDEVYFVKPSISIGSGVSSANNGYRVNISGMIKIDNFTADYARIVLKIRKITGDSVIIDPKGDDSTFMRCCLIDTTFKDLVVTRMYQIGNNTPSVNTESQQNQ